VAETPKERTDRQLIELLNELRVALPGAQVLLAFLLAVPFATRFGRTSTFERALLFACAIVTAAGVLFLMAPSVYHRVRWQEGGKADVVRVGHLLFLLGSGCLAAGMCLALCLVGDVVFGPAAAIAATAVMAVLIVTCWYVLSLRRGKAADVRAEE